MTGTPTNACKMMSRADLWLMRNYWDLDFPRPVLPNFIFLGGVHCQPAKPLPKVWAVFNITTSFQFFFRATLYMIITAVQRKTNKHCVQMFIYFFFCL